MTELGPTYNLSEPNETIDTDSGKQSESDIVDSEPETQPNDDFFDPSLKDKPIEQWTEVQKKAQTEFALSKLEKKVDDRVACIEAETEEKVLDIAGETYYKITQELGMSEPEAIQMVGEDKMIKILGPEKVKKIKDDFDREVMVSAKHILDDAFSKVESTINESIPKLANDISAIIEDK